jgi:hypothetical protein
MRSAPGQRFESVRIKAQLQDVARLAFLSGQLRVNRLISTERPVDVVDSNEKVRDATDAIKGERHLIDHVEVTLQGIAHSINPLKKSLFWIATWNLIDGLASILELRETVGLVALSFGDKEFSQRSQGMGRDDELARVRAITQREEV